MASKVERGNPRRRHSEPARSLDMVVDDLVDQIDQRTEGLTAHGYAQVLRRVVDVLVGRLTGRKAGGG